MRVLIATPLYPPESGGPATYAKLLSEGLPSLGDEVTIVRFAEVRDYPKLLRQFMYLRLLMHAAKNADVILVLDPVSTGFPAAVAAFLRQKPLVLKVVGDYAWEQGKQRFGVTASLDDFVRMGRVPLPVAILRALQVWVAGRARTIIVPSEYLKQIVCAWGEPAAKIHVVPNAIAPVEGGEVPEAVAALPHPVVVTVARLVPWKGIDQLIEAVAQARDQIGTLSLVIVGDGPEHVRLTELARAKLGSDYVVTGALPPSDTQAVIRQSDLFVLNSTYEGLSHVLIEALMAGKAVIATQAGGNEEVLGPEGGVLVPIGDTQALARELVRLANDRPLREQLGTHAQSRAAHFTVPVMLSRTKDVLTRAV